MDEWYVRADLAKYLAAGGHSKEALLESLKAAKAHGPFEFKVNLFKQIASQLIAVERSESAAPFLQANICIRDGKGWPKDDEVWSMANQLSVDLDGPSLPNVERQVKSTLDVLLEEFDPLLPGVIKTVLPNGKSGFLTDSSGSDRFFGVRDLKIRPSELSAGLKVRFRPDLQRHSIKRKTANLRLRPPSSSMMAERGFRIGTNPTSRPIPLNYPSTWENSAHCAPCWYLDQSE